MVKMADLVTASTFAVGLCCGFLLRSRWFLIKKVLFNSKNTQKPVEDTKRQVETEKVFFLLKSINYVSHLQVIFFN
jgi:hypothetical protein